MLFRQVSRQHNREIENEFHIFFTANFARKRSNLPRKVRYELSRGANCRAKDRSKLPCTVNYRLKYRAVPNNRCPENAANYRDLSRKYRAKRNFFEKLRKARNFDDIRLHYFCTILYHLQNQGNLFRGLKGRPIESYKNYEIYENCEIYDNSQYHLQNQGNIFKGLQGRPIESYENYEIYENCEIYDNSQYHLQDQRKYIQRVAGKAHRKSRKLQNFRKL